MKKLISDIKERLVATVTSAKYIDEDWGQLDYFNPNQPVKWPCILIDLDEIPWSNQGALVQIGMASVTLRVADMKLSNTNVKAPTTQQEKAQGILDLLSGIQESLHGWTADSMNGPMTRTMTRKVKRDDGIREFELTYSVQVIDTTAKHLLDTYHVTNENLQIEPRFIKAGR